METTMRLTAPRFSTNALRRRITRCVLPVLLATGALGFGLSWMTHMHHLGLRHVDQAQMTRYDAPYEQLSDALVIPTGVLGVACSVALLALRPHGLPPSLIGCNLVLQLAVFVTRVGTWGTWAEEVREAGSVFLADGSLHPSYLLYVDTNWVRIAMIGGHALLSLVLVTMAVSRDDEPGSCPPASRAAVSNA
jgi:hypothetical protein